MPSREEAAASTLESPEPIATTKRLEDDGYIRIRRSELVSILTLIDEMKKRLQELGK